MASRGRQRRAAAYPSWNQILGQKSNRLRNQMQRALDSLADHPRGQRLSGTLDGLQGHFQPVLSRLESLLDSQLGWLPVLSLSIGLGLLMISTAFRTSVSNTGDSAWLYWLGLVILVVPVATRLAMISVTRQERLSLVMLLVIALYILKVIHRPSAFTYSDELVHYANANQVLKTLGVKTTCGYGAQPVCPHLKPIMRGYSMFWLAPDPAGSPGQIEIGLRSMEFEPHAFQIKLYDGEQLVQRWEGIQLDPKQAWSLDFIWDDSGGGSGPLEARLYRVDQPDALYRQVRLWPSTQSNSTVSGEQ